MRESNKQKLVFSNLIWRFAERCGAQVVQFIVSIVLARILMPETYGTVAIVLAFAQILQVFVDSGLANALIQKKDADDLDFSSVFYFNVIWCFVLYGLAFFSAPAIARFYDNPALTEITRVLGLTVIISGLKNVQQAYVSKNMQFKKFFFSTLFGTIVSAIVGIAVALAGGEVWALVAQKLTNLLVDTLVLWFTVEWLPKKMFSITRLKGLISYGWKLLAAALLDSIYGNLRTFVIGKMYTEADLAYYNQGNQFTNIIVGNINSSIDSVLLPVMSDEQNNREAVKQMTRRSIKISTYIMAPMMMGLFFVAPSVIELVLTEKWLPCVPYLRIFCITYMFYPIHTANLNAIKALGRSDLFLKLEVIKKVIGLLLLIVSMKYGVMVMAYSLIVSSVSSQIINTWPNKKLLNYSYIEQLRDIIPNILLALFMGICVTNVVLLNLSVLLTLCIQVFLGILIYVLASIISKNESFLYLWGILQSFFYNFKTNK